MMESLIIAFEWDGYATQQEKTALLRAIEEIIKRLRQEVGCTRLYSTGCRHAKAKQVRVRTQVTRLIREYNSISLGMIDSRGKPNQSRDRNRNVIL